MEKKELVESWLIVSGLLMIYVSWGTVEKQNIFPNKANFMQVSLQNNKKKERIKPYLLRSK